MKRAVSVSLGSSTRAKAVEIELLGEQVRIERRGTDGDVEKATALFTELDGQVDALGVGGIDLWVLMGDRRFNITAAQKMVKRVHKTPVVDGSGLKNTLERHVVHTMIEQMGDRYASGRVLLTAGVDRYGMTLAFVEQNYECVFGDLMFALGLPIPIRKFSTFKIVVGMMAAPATKLPISVLYPTGDKQDQIVPKFEKHYQWASVIAGDCHYIKRHMPDDLTGKVIVTNTTVPQDLEMFKQRGVTHVVTSTPMLDGRSFGTNMMEAALTAVANKNRLLTHDELNSMIKELDMQPTVHVL
ncbi:MAG: quinate 5-dehydrogenase [Chloroflexi bacterium]|nr:quinate 5-dehydrogenase [Chloroflexota bacterium]